jgi:hypothetical protein
MVKVKKFGIGRCVPHRMAADNAKGGSVQPPPGCNRVNHVDANGRKSSNLVKSHELTCHFIRLYLVPLPP